MLSKHGVEMDEAREALLSVRHADRARRGPEGEARYLAHRQTLDGRRLDVVFTPEPRGGARIITAYEPEGDSQRRRHRRH
jgi:uncharacterized DUF497 family protein